MESSFVVVLQIFSDDPYFATLTYHDEEYEGRERIEIEQPNFFGTVFLGGLGNRYKYKPVARTRSVINGIKQTAASVCSAITISLHPTQLALPWFQIFVAFIFSKSTLTAFLRCEREKELSWKSRELENKGDWQTMHCGLKDKEAVVSMAHALLRSATNKVLNEVARAVDVPPETDVAGI